jgi:hypothetical protein
MTDLVCRLCLLLFSLKRGRKEENLLREIYNHYLKPEEAKDNTMIKKSCVGSSKPKWTHILLGTKCCVSTGRLIC